MYPHATFPYLFVCRYLRFNGVYHLYETTQSTELQASWCWFVSVVGADTFGTCHRHTIRGPVHGPRRMTTWRAVSFDVILQLLRDLCAMCECPMKLHTPTVYRKTILWEFNKNGDHYTETNVH